MLTVVTCAEDELAARVAQHLFRRALAEESSVDHVRANVSTIEFKGLEGREAWTLNRELSSVLERHGKRIGVHPPPGLRGNALRAYRLVRYAQMLRREAIVVLLLAYDRDGRSEEEGLRAGASAASPKDVAVVVAEAQPEFDAWVLCGFVPENDLERLRLDDWQSRLKVRGVDVLKTPERLSSDARKDERDSKVLTRDLLGLGRPMMGSEERVLRCLDRPLADLRSRGARTGLPEFLDDACEVVDGTQRP